MLIKKLIFLFLTVGLLISCGPTEQPQLQPGELILSYTLENEKLKSGIAGDSATLQKAPHQMVLTIKDENGNIVFNAERLDLIKIGDQHYSKNLLLNTGNYTLEEFMVIDSADNAIYIAPKATSNLANYINNPLPYEFEIMENSTSTILVQVVPAYLGSAAEFGYSAFSFNVVLPYIELEYTNFFKMSNQEIVDSLAILLNIKPFQYIGKVDKYDHGFYIPWIDHGLKYTNADDHTIIFWNDFQDDTWVISYLHYRWSQSNVWQLTNEQIKEYLNEIFLAMGKSILEKDTFYIRNSAAGAHNLKWYNVDYYQKFKTKLLRPEFFAEIEGERCKINYMIIPLWYKNLNKIEQLIPDSELIKRARNYFQEYPEVDSVPDQLNVHNYSIMHNKLTKKVGSAILDIHDSRMYVYVDIQNGEIVEMEKNYRR